MDWWSVGVRAWRQARPSARRRLPWSTLIAASAASLWAPTRPMTWPASWPRCGSRSVSPHIAIDGHLSKTGKPRKTSVDRRVTRHGGYDISQRCRKRIEEVFGWIKASAGLAAIKLRGRARVDAVFTLGLAAYHLARLLKLLAAPA